MARRPVLGQPLDPAEFSGLTPYAGILYSATLLWRLRHCDACEECSNALIALKGAVTESIDAGWSSLVARRAHNPKVVGSNPAPATNLMTACCSPIVTRKPLLGLFLWPKEKGRRKHYVGQGSVTDAALRPTVESMGYSLWGIELISPGRGPR